MGIGDFVKRHQRKILVALGFSATAYWVYNYLNEKLKELKQNILLEQITREDMERRFEQAQRDATFTTLALLPTASEAIIKRYNVEETRKELQGMRNVPENSPTASTEPVDSLQGANPSINQIKPTELATPPQSKADLWNLIKIQSISRVFLLIYLDSLLTVLTRLQLNILGRRSYEEVISKQFNNESAANEKFETSDRVNRQYLTFSWWLLHDGWELLAKRVESAVSSVMGGIEPPKKISFDELNNLLGQVHKQIDEEGTFAQIMLPPPEVYALVLNQVPGEESKNVTPELQSLVDETSAVCESQNCSEVVAKLVHAGLTQLMQHIKPSYNESEEIRLAIVLLSMAKQAHSMAAGSPHQNEYVECMLEHVPELDALCAKVYSNY